MDRDAFLGRIQDLNNKNRVVQLEAVEVARQLAMLDTHDAAWWRAMERRMRPEVVQGIHNYCGAIRSAHQRVEREILTRFAVTVASIPKNLEWLEDWPQKMVTTANYVNEVYPNTIPNTRQIQAHITQLKTDLENFRDQPPALEPVPQMSENAPSSVRPLQRLPYIDEMWTEPQHAPKKQKRAKQDEPVTEPDPRDLLSTTMYPSQFSIQPQPPPQMQYSQSTTLDMPPSVMSRLTRRSDEVD